jgi:hypothetical protein
MSCVTTAILTFQLMGGDAAREAEEVEAETLAAINEKMIDSQWFHVTSREAWGNNKAPQMCVALGTFNHVDISHIEYAVRSVGWPKGHRVQLIINEEHDDAFSIIEVNG